MRCCARDSAMIRNEAPEAFAPCLRAFGADHPPGGEIAITGGVAVGSEDRG